MCVCEREREREREFVYVFVRLCVSVNSLRNTHAHTQICIHECVYVCVCV